MGGCARERERVERDRVYSSVDMCACVYECVCIHACVSAHVFSYVYVRVWENMCECIYVCIRACLCLRVWWCVCM